MSDDNDSGGIIGAIISIFLLAALWPYILALLGIYIAYMIAIAILEWIAKNWILVLTFFAAALFLYGVIRHRIIQRLWNTLVTHYHPISQEVMLPEVLQRPVNSFKPSTNLYCYWCTKKLGIKAFELNGKYYCLDCNQALLSNKLDRGG